MRQSYEKKQHEARKNEKKTHAKRRKPTRKKKKATTRKDGQNQHKRSPRPTPNEPHRTPPMFENARPLRLKMNAKTKNRAWAAGGTAARWAGRLVEVVRWKSDQTFRRTAPLVVCRQPAHLHGVFVKEDCASGPWIGAGRRAPPVGL